MQLRTFKQVGESHDPALRMAKYRDIEVGNIILVKCPEGEALLLALLVLEPRIGDGA